MLQSIQQGCLNYYNELPEKSIKNIGLSALLTFTSSIIFATLSTGHNQPISFYRPFLATAISILSSTIHALTNPLFRYLFQNSANEYNGFKNFLQCITDITFTELLIYNTTACRINLITTTIPGGNNFAILPHDIIKMSCDMIFRTTDYFSGPGFPLRQAMISILQQWGIDLNVDANDIYLTA